MTAASTPQGEGRVDRVPARSAPSVPTPTDTLPSVEPRAGGVLRLTTSRTVDARCLGCSATFGSTGPAAAHARSTRHTVQVAYGSSFMFVAGERVSALAGGAA